MVILSNFVSILLIEAVEFRLDEICLTFVESFVDEVSFMDLKDDSNESKCEFWLLFLLFRSLFELLIEFLLDDSCELVLFNGTLFSCLSALPGPLLNSLFGANFKEL